MSDSIRKYVLTHNVYIIYCIKNEFFHAFTTALTGISSVLNSSICLLLSNSSHSSIVWNWSLYFVGNSLDLIVNNYIPLIRTIRASNAFPSCIFIHSVSGALDSIIIL